MTQFTGKRVLIVEDEALIAMLLSQMLEDVGIVPLGPAATLAEAEELALDGGFDAALLDLNLEDGQSYPIARMLRAAAKPFAFTSGSHGIDEAYADVPALTKPFVQADLELVLERLLLG